MIPKSPLVACLLALTLAACGAGLETDPLPASAAPSSPSERLADVRLVEAVDGDACEVVPRRSTSDASGRREGFTMATVRCAWSAPPAKARPSARARAAADAATTPGH